VRRTVVLLGLVGCYAPAPAEDLPCGAGRRCPSGQTCDVDEHCRSVALDAGADSEIDAPSTPTDLDGDTIPNAADNCPMTGNTDQRDHDTDGAGDVCDNCPHLANPMQEAAMDTDLVGDACDPDNARADTFVYFEGFYDAAPPGWVLPNGFSVQSGKLVGIVGANGLLAYKDMAVPPDVTVIAHGAMTVQTGLSRNIGPGARATGGVDYYKCDTLDNRVEVVEQIGNNGNVLASQPLGNPDLRDITYTFDLTGAVLRCSVLTNNVTTTTMATDAQGLQMGDRTGLRVRNCTGTFDYIVVYSH
jgi:hypothetical protein